MVVPAVWLERKYLVNVFLDLTVVDSVQSLTLVRLIPVRMVVHAWPTPAFVLLVLLVLSAKPTSTPTPCLNSGLCSDGVVHMDVTCNCSLPWVGKFCQIHENDCLTSTCQNGATCVDGYFSHACTCASGFTGVVCQTDIDECPSKPCQNAMPTSECDCLSGFMGALCEINIDECASEWWNLRRQGEWTRM